MNRFSMFVAASTLLTGVLFAQTAPSTQTTTVNQPSTVNERRENQQDRIAQGIRSGQMTAGETARAEGHEQRINQQIHADRSANGGTLTGSERRQVNREQNGASRQIYREKHNGRTGAR